MNIENRYPVTASLFMLKEIKRRQDTVDRGYKLLRRKVDALRFKGHQAAVELAATQALLGHTMREAYMTLAAVKFTNGEPNAMVLESVSEAQIRVQRVLENVSGVTTVSLQAVEVPTAGDTLRYAGLAAGGHRTTEAKKAFREVICLVIKFASLRTNCLLLDDAVKTTLRKVKGIEKVIMPKLNNTERYILMEMDEREREEFHRLKMVKAKKVNSSTFTKRRAEMRSEKGEGEDNENKCQYGFERSELETRYLTSRTSLGCTSIESGGDFKPTCCPHYWDDEDLLF